MAPFAAVLQLPFGRLGLHLAAGRLTGLVFVAPSTPLQPPSCDLGRLVETQLQDWCHGTRLQFDLPWQAQGTPFQQRVWQAMQAIPCGSTRTYGDVAAELASSARAVGGACGRNPLPLVIPCHRIVAQNGLGGFNQGQQDWLLAIKDWLLRHERTLAARAA